MTTFFYEDGQENLFNEHGEKVYDPMEDFLTQIDDPNIVLETITNRETYLSAKRPEKATGEPSVTKPLKSNEAGFHINMRLNWARPKSGKKAIVKQPQTRAPTHTIIGAIHSSSIIHSKPMIRKIESKGYRVMYLPPYSPELNSIEQFWAIVKGKMKCDRLMNEENLCSRITDACNDILISDLNGFCNHSKRQIVNCYNKTPF
ncbi:hypothetical protein CU097_008583 [Rhizopus azygosporus]|uniref:Tc1-like transposase DDE domain-containing protein n=1 Tax=Rhizopus azygosporus TaxID=86630 RepID=A0A367J5J6_RHIAZ|nr:hypothetical protein CU097_008583 [Rhizopus azygosporus]